MWWEIFWVYIYMNTCACILTHAYIHITFISIFISTILFMSTYITTFLFFCSLEENTKKKKANNCTNNVTKRNAAEMKNLTGKEWSCDTLKCLSSTDASKIHLACKGWWRDMWMLNQFKSWELPVFVFLQKKQNSVGWLQPLAWLEYFFFKIFFCVDHF